MIRFLLEALAAILITGLVLGAVIPLVHTYLEPLPRVVFHVLVVAVFAISLVAATFRPGGSLRK